ncbi:MAG: sulfatase/phosphatase domain-containing protein, partial [Bacteroidota bacterium]
VHHDVPAHFGIRTKDHKLIYYYSEHYDTTAYGRGSMWWKDESYPIESTPKAWEFYDLSKDPQELVNRYEDAEYQDIISQLKEELKRMRADLKETDQDYPHLEKVIAAYW